MVVQEDDRPDSRVIFKWQGDDRLASECVRGCTPYHKRQDGLMDKNGSFALQTAGA